MKKMKYIFALSLMVSTGLRADDSEKLARLVELAERAEVREAKMEEHIVAYFAAAQSVLVTIVIPQVAREIQYMSPRQQQENIKNLSLFARLVGLTPEQVQDAFTEAKKNQEVAVEKEVNQDVPAAPADQPKQAIPTALEVVAGAESPKVPNADDSLLEKAAATLDGTN